ncbi:hypothetical protein RDI58_007492 [Solanum bulbocastanum]|uniref:Uncharacterized protein n=1 Tax=Solanum bulbocastanum TaxID=147425 RepID=A0AAN8TV55_SOLBU
MEEYEATDEVLSLGKKTRK